MRKLVGKPGIVLCKTVGKVAEFSRIVDINPLINNFIVPTFAYLHTTSTLSFPGRLYCNLQLYPEYTGPTKITTLNIYNRSF